MADVRLVADDHDMRTSHDVAIVSYHTATVIRPLPWCSLRRSADLTGPETMLYLVLLTGSLADDV